MAVGSTNERAPARRRTAARRCPSAWVGGSGPHAPKRCARCAYHRVASSTYHGIALFPPRPSLAAARDLPALVPTSLGAPHPSQPP